MGINTVLELFAVLLIIGVPVLVIAALVHRTLAIGAAFLIGFMIVGWLIWNFSLFTDVTAGMPEWFANAYALMSPLAWLLISAGLIALIFALIFRTQTRAFASTLAPSKAFGSEGGFLQRLMWIGALLALIFLFILPLILPPLVEIYDRIGWNVVGGTILGLALAGAIYTSTVAMLRGYGKTVAHLILLALAIALFPIIWDATVRSYNWLVARDYIVPEFWKDKRYVKAHPILEYPAVPYYGQWRKVDYNDPRYAQAYEFSTAPGKNNWATGVVFKNVPPGGIVYYYINTAHQVCDHVRTPPGVRFGFPHKGGSPSSVQLIDGGGDIYVHLVVKQPGEQCQLHTAASF